MAEENTPNTPRPIGIKPITIKPMQPAQKPFVTEAAKAEDGPAKPQPPTTDTPNAETQPEAPAKPISITPNVATGKTLAQAAGAPTIRLKTIRRPLDSTSDLQSVVSPPQSMRPPTIQPPSIKPSTHPPLDSATKSKTSRISLDSAFGDGAVSPTINIGKSTTAPVGKITSSFSADSLTAPKGLTAKVNLPLSSSDSEVTRRRTLRVKAPTASPGLEKTDRGDSLTEAPTVRKKKAIVLKKNVGPSDGQAGADGTEEEAHVSAFSAFQSQTVEKTNPVFPVLAVAAIFMIVTLTVLYMSQACGPDRSLTAFSSFPGVSSPRWPGQVNTF